MAIVATVTFLNTQNIGLSSSGKISAIHACWLICAVAGLLSVAFFAVSSQLESQRLLVILAIITGFGYLMHGIGIGGKIPIVSGIGWWVGAAVLATRHGIESIAILAFLVILLTILPLILEMRQKRIGFF